MAPNTPVSLLAKRYYCNYDGYGNGYDDYTNCNSTWNSWARWVVFAIIVVAVLIFAFLCSCINTRRRRRRGQPPMYGTGWMPGHKSDYNGGAAPPYSAQPQVENQLTGNTHNSNEGYYGNSYNNGYGGSNGGIELQQPSHTYQPRGGEPVYEAPQGPPPGKGDGIIR